MMAILKTVLNVGLIGDNDYIEGDVKVKDHCHVTGKRRGPAQRTCNIKLKLNYKVSIF